MSDKTVVYTESAITTIGAMNNHVHKLRAHYGPGSSEHTEAAERLAHVMHTIIMAGFSNHAVVSKDGDLSLFVNEGAGSYVYGIIWHGTKRGCTNEGCHAVLNDDGLAWVYSRDWHMCDSHVPSYPYDAPQPGSWSVHS
jgi:hypothetical protein